MAILAIYMFVLLSVISIAKVLYSIVISHMYEDVTDLYYCRFEFALDMLIAVFFTVLTLTLIFR